MKKLAVLVASLICFAGCARNDSETSAEGTSDTGYGAAGTTQSGQDSDMNNYGTTTTPSPGLGATGVTVTNDNSSSIRASGSLGDTNSTSLGDTNSSDTNINTLGDTNSIPQPLPPGAGGQSGTESGAGSQEPQPSQQDQGSASPTGNNSQSQQDLGGNGASGLNQDPQ